MTGRGAVPRHRGQSGFMLVFVLAMLGLITVLSTVLLAMTITALRTSDGFRDNWASLAAADGAMEQVVADLRSDDDAALEDCYGAGDEGSGHPSAYRKTFTLDGSTWDVVVDCETVQPIVDERDVTLFASVVSGPGANPAQVLGASRVVITDQVGGDLLPGQRLEVCDWQLGQTVNGVPAAC